jgi:hypothetical protein
MMLFLKVSQRLSGKAILQINVNLNLKPMLSSPCLRHSLNTNSVSDSELWTVATYISLILCNEAKKPGDSTGTYPVCKEL